MTKERFAFILRVWMEDDRGKVGGLRGSLQEADSDDVYYFSSFDIVPEILRQMMIAAEFSDETQLDEDKSK